MKNKHSEQDETMQEQPDFKRLGILMVVGVLVIISAFILITKSAAKKTPPKETAQTVKTATGKKTPAQPIPTIQKFMAASDVTWNAKAGIVYPYKFSYPATLPLVVFINDLTDKVAIAWNNIPPQQNLLLNMEFVNDRDPKYAALPKIEFVKNWYKFFSGLTGVSKIEPFTNTQGMKGYKAWYINTANSAPNLDVFFEVPKRNDIMIHMANGIIDPPVFDKILDTVRWEEKNPTPTIKK
jgi:hypothetical protein